MPDITGDSTRTQIALRIPAPLMVEVDARAEALGISRNQWFENMARWCIANTATVTSKGQETE